jgi:hypothetical protein
MSEPARPTGRTCAVRVHEQIRRNTGPAERVHPGSPETKPAEAGSQRLGGSRIPHAGGKPVETPQNVLPPTRSGSNARMLVPETMAGRDAAPHRHRGNRSTGTATCPCSEGVRSARMTGLRGAVVRTDDGGEEPTGSGRSLGHTRRASPIAGHQLIRRK